MRVRGYCNYKITIPAGKSFPGEKLLIDFNTDAIRAMEHQADLIAIAHDIRLKQRRPIDLNDRELVANNYSRFHGWMSGGTDGERGEVLQGAWIDRLLLRAGRTRSPTELGSARSRRRRQRAKPPP